MWLTEDVGHPKLLQHLEAVKTLMKVSTSWEQFKEMLDVACRLHFLYLTEQMVDEIGASMAHKFRVKGLSGVQLKSDGTEIALEFQTAQREKLTIVVPGYESRQIAYQMMQFDRQAQTKREIPPDAERLMIEYVAPPYIFVTAPNGLQCVVRPKTGDLDLQVQDIHGQEVQISLMPQHVKALFEALLQVQDFPEEKPN